MKQLFHHLQSLPCPSMSQTSLQQSLCFSDKLTKMGKEALRMSLDDLLICGKSLSLSFLETIIKSNFFVNKNVD